MTHFLYCFTGFEASIFNAASSAVKSSSPSASESAKERDYPTYNNLKPFVVSIKAVFAVLWYEVELVIAAEHFGNCAPLLTVWK